MLSFLRVRNFAIIEDLEVEFGEGFNVITGETGAGKSIVINALATLFNGKVAPDVVRAGADQAEITAYHSLNGEEYILKRSVSPLGRSRASINDSASTLKKLEELGVDLVNLYGQNESQDLLDKDNYLTIIDNLLSLQEDRKLMGEMVRRLRDMDTELGRKTKEVEGRDREISLLQFQIEEIEREGLKEGEETTLRERMAVLKDAEKIETALRAVATGLDDQDGSARAILKASLSHLRPFLAVESIEGLHKRIEALAFDIEDICGEIKKQEKRFIFDPDELQRLEERISTIYRLQQKYGKNWAEIQAYLRHAKERLSYLSDLADDVEALQKKRSIMSEEVDARAATLSEMRKRGIPAIESQVVDELALLSMKNARFSVSITDKGEIDEEGRDEMEFLLSTNPGEPLRPLRRVASGGELSRIMLALKKVLGGSEGRTLIFDEIDAGIGGKVAAVVGKRLKDLSRRNQVICITHLPQIAAFGNHHFLVEKRQQEGRTRTFVRRLERRERTEEIARMIGGMAITDKSLERAEEMLRDAEKGTY
ncbi:MAG TPA: DNA repair protein RecN [Deltaproteobacteria bacterium]|nr:DNA repair protein RecN [Deltaproteobacteria bacterium]